MRRPHKIHPYATEVTSAAARASRPAAGQVAVDHPEATRVAFADAMAAGPEVAEPLLLTGCNMSYDARTREDWELNTLFMDHDTYVFHPGEPSEGGPEFAGTYEGIEGYISAMREFGEGWSSLKVAGGPVKVLDEHRALSKMLWKAAGARSGLTMEWTAIGLFQFRDGLIVDQRFWWSAESARRQLGGGVPSDW